MEVLSDGPYDKGLDSSTHSLLLPKGAYPWAQNIVNSGGVISTRQGLYEIVKSTLGPPRGMTIFTPTGGVPHIVVALDTGIYHLASPFTGNLVRIQGLTFATSTRKVYFESAMQAQETRGDGTVHVLPVPKPVLMIQDGQSQAGYWDGTHAAHLSFTDKQCPVGTWMKWIGSRLWVMQRNKIYASDIYNPIQFTETKDLATGGFLVLPAEGTGMGVTFDFKTLLAFTDLTTTAIQAGLTDRTLWSRTQDFQRVMFPNIGCVSGRTFVNQYGISWWMSHNGVIGLDNALQTYQTSSIHVKDQNMSRSKCGITNWNGGGCAGTFGNSLFFSVPSGGFYNKHTWLMDQGVITSLQRDSPAAWSANWTGIRPEEWITAVIRGKQRCFCVSYDPVPTGYQSTVWEAFIGQRQDIPHSSQTGDHVAHDIACSWESKFLALSPDQVMRFRYAELDIAEIQGRVNIEVFYCGIRTSYKSILKKKLYARPAGHSDDEDFNPDTIVGVAMPQSRVLRTVTDLSEVDDNDPQVQTETTRNRDRAFSILVTWTGRMTLAGLRVYVDPDGQLTEGVDQQDETTDRWVDAEGHGAITLNPTQPNKMTALIQSQNLEVFTPRWVEFPAYDAATANGVFFVIVPLFTPRPGNYDTDWPIPVKIESETSNCDIVYTIDGTNPTYTDPTHHHGIIVNNGATVNVPQGRTLKAIAVRAGMTNSAMESGRYDKETLAKPVFEPGQGAYDADAYPMDINITSDGDRIRYTRDGVNPTRTLGTLIPAGNGIATINIPPKTLKAIAYKLDQSSHDSLVTTGHYTAKVKVTTPTIHPEGGQFHTFPQSFHIWCQTQDSHIRFTTDGTDPSETHGILTTTGSEHTIQQPKTVKAIGFKNGCTTSEIDTAVFELLDLSANAPTFDPEGGNYGLSLTVHINTTTTGGTIYYTKDGTDPGPSNPDSFVVQGSDVDVVYNWPAPTTRTLKAMVTKSGELDSPIHAATYHFS